MGWPHGAHACSLVRSHTSCPKSALVALKICNLQTIFQAEEVGNSSFRRVALPLQRAKVQKRQKTTKT
eukprot:1775902-Amphidinium_carterae.1